MIKPTEWSSSRLSITHWCHSGHIHNSIRQWWDNGHRGWLLENPRDMAKVHKSWNWVNYRLVTDPTQKFMTRIHNLVIEYTNTPYILNACTFTVCGLRVQWPDLMQPKLTIWRTGDNDPTLLHAAWSVLPSNFRFKPSYKLSLHLKTGLKRSWIWKIQSRAGVWF